MISTTLTVHIATDVELVRNDAGDWRLSSDDTVLTLGALDEPLARLLERMLRVGAPQQDVLMLGGAGVEMATHARWHLLLEALASQGILRLALSNDGEALATIIPTSTSFAWPTLQTPPPHLTLSRFAYVRRDGSDLLLESPNAHCRVRLDAPSAVECVLSSVTGAVGVGQQAALCIPEQPPLQALRSILAQAGMLVPLPDGSDSADERPPLVHWEFHDLLFHWRSRAGRHAAAMGGTYRLRGQFADPVLAAERPTLGMIALPRPDMEALRRTDVTLTSALEERRSLREQGTTPLSLGALGELLYRCAATRAALVDQREGVARRPYPSGGARYPIVLHVVAHRCDGLAPGLYTYAPAEHSLKQIRPLDPITLSLLRDAQVGRDLPQVLLVLASRFERISYKYESIAYALTLKEAGALTQTLYLVGTAMGLAVCAVGNGNVDTFAQALGVDRNAESSVAEVVVGSTPLND
jgi:oxazoline/thiazoline dehydrogenase